MKILPLPHGKCTVVDDADYEALRQHRWCLQGQNKYVARRVNGEIVFLHRLLANVPAGMWVDHINGNKLDNRRCNLRAVTPQQNCQNRKKAAGRSSKYIGVTFHKVARKWQAHIRLDGHLKYIGLFDKEEDAAQAYDARAKESRGEYAKLNFAAEQVAQ